METSGPSIFRNSSSIVTLLANISSRHFCSVQFFFRIITLVWWHLMCVLYVWCVSTSLWAHSVSELTVCWTPFLSSFGFLHTPKWCAHGLIKNDILYLKNGWSFCWCFLLTEHCKLNITNQISGIIWIIFGCNIKEKSLSKTSTSDVQHLLSVAASHGCNFKLMLTAPVLCWIRESYHWWNLFLEQHYINKAIK